jgi:hypothetical protein
VLNFTLVVVTVAIVCVASLCANQAGLEEPAGVAHFKPVLSALSATNLIQEQSQRIVQ